MSLARWAFCALLLVLVAAPLSVHGMQAASYGGWPALGFAIALYLAAGAERVWQVSAALTIVLTVALMTSYQVPGWIALLGSCAVILPALFTRNLLTKVNTGHLRLDEVDSGHYHAVTALSALLCGLISIGATATLLEPREVLLAGLMSFFAALTAQISVLPSLSATRAPRPPVAPWSW